MDASSLPHRAIPLNPPLKKGALGIAAAFNIQGAAQPECPVFVLRADEPGHLHTLIELQNYSWTREAEQSVRAFELWEEAHRR